MASRYGKLPLDDSPRTLVFRALDDVVRTNPTIKNVCRPESIRSWQGDPADKAEFGITQAPAIRMTPVPMPEAHWYPGATKGSLFVRFDVLTKGLAIDDVDNLVHAFKRALLPREHSEALAIHAKLKTAGAMTGEIIFSQPAYDPDPAAGSDGCFRASGLFGLEVRTS